MVERLVRAKILDYKPGKEFGKLVPLEGEYRMTQIVFFKKVIDPQFEHYIYKNQEVRVLLQKENDAIEVKKIEIGFNNEKTNSFEELTTHSEIESLPIIDFSDKQTKNSSKSQNPTNSISSSPKEILLTNKNKFTVKFRLELLKNLLEKSDSIPIYIIAEKGGFKDEKETENWLLGLKKMEFKIDWITKIVHPEGKNLQAEIDLLLQKYTESSKKE